MQTLNHTHTTRRHDIVDQFTRQAEAFADKHCSMHHFLDPAALAAMTRTCAPGGKVVVIAATPVSAKAEGYNAFEKLRDLSNTPPCRWKNCSD